MRHLLICIALLNCMASFEARSQGFAHVYQAPLLLNPSFAGSTGGARLAAVTNFGKTDGSNIQNNYLSFDHLLKKSGIGIGGAVYTYKREGISSFYAYQTVGGSLAIAPKYVLNTRNGTKRATLSPSIGIDYSVSDRSYKWYDYSETQAYTNSDPLDFEFISDNSQFSKDLKLSAGLLYNSEKLILGFVYTNRRVEQNFEVHKMRDDSASIQYYYLPYLVNGESVYDSTKPYFTEYHDKKNGTVSLKGTIHTFDFHVSKIIKFGSSKFSLVPSLLIGVAYYNRIASNRYNDYSVNKLNLALQLNYGKIFFGGGAATGVDAYMGFAGYKSDKLKIMGSYNFIPNRPKNMGETRSFELSVNYNLKFKKRQIR